MVWIQIWTDPHEFLRSETIASLSCRSMKKGQRDDWIEIMAHPMKKGQHDDWIEIIAHPMEKVILQYGVNAGHLPHTEQDQKAWQTLVNSRALLVLEEVVRIISDPGQPGKLVSLRDLIKLDFDRKVPRSLDIEIWVWHIPCHNCHQGTPVVYPVGAFFGYMLEFNFLSNLPLMLAEKYPFFKKGSGPGKTGEEYRNTCMHCGATQPDWRVMESYLELVNTPEIVQEKSRLAVPLTEEEKEEYAKAGISSSW